MVTKGLRKYFSFILLRQIIVHFDTSIYNTMVLSIKYILYLVLQKEEKYFSTNRLYFFDTNDCAFLTQVCSKQ